MELCRNGISKWRRTPDGTWSRGVYRLMRSEGETDYRVFVCVDGGEGEEISREQSVRAARLLVNRLLDGDGESP